MKPYWIKERNNPQLGIYFVACGQLSKTAAKAQERQIYGENVMHRFENEADYLAELTRLRKKGERVH